LTLWHGATTSHVLNPAWAALRGDRFRDREAVRSRWYFASLAAVLWTAQRVDACHASIRAREVRRDAWKSVDPEPIITYAQAVIAYIVGAGSWDKDSRLMPNDVADLIDDAAAVFVGRTVPMALLEMHIRKVAGVGEGGFYMPSGSLLMLTSRAISPTIWDVCEPLLEQVRTDGWSETLALTLVPGQRPSLEDEFRQHSLMLQWNLRAIELFADVSQSERQHRLDTLLGVVD
jgi:hypothetical protein